LWEYLAHPKPTFCNTKEILSGVKKFKIALDQYE
jgi:hypothetical protein